MEPEEFEVLVKEGTSASIALGNSDWSMQESERESRRLRRSLYIVHDVKAGDIVTYENVRAIRPGGGCGLKFLEGVLGKSFHSAFNAGTPMSTDLIRTNE